MHLQGEQIVYLEGDELNVEIQTENARKTELTEFFEFNTQSRHHDSVLKFSWEICLAEEFKVMENSAASICH